MVVLGVGARTFGDSCVAITKKMFDLLGIPLSEAPEIIYYVLVSEWNKLKDQIAKTSPHFYF